MALETLSTVVALGYQISFREGNHTPLQFMELSPERYLQPNGYLPRPVDLEGVILGERLTDLIEKLAENAHNVWAASRIKEGWTYGTASVSSAPPTGLSHEGRNRSVFVGHMLNTCLSCALSQNNEAKRNPLLVPYSKLDAPIKKSNRYELLLPLAIPHYCPSYPLTGIRHASQCAPSVLWGAASSRPLLIRSLPSNS